MLTNVLEKNILRLTLRIINVDYKRISMDYESWWIRNRE